MSTDAERIETDLEAFRDLALEEQIKIPYYQARGNRLEAVFKKLDPILSEILGEYNRVGLMGEVHFCDLVTNDTYSPIESAKKSPVFGISMGIEIASQNHNVYASTYHGGRLVVGYSVQNPSGVYHDTDEEGEYTYGFAPVESSKLLVPDVEFPKFVTPEEGDDVADDIEKYLYDEFVDLHGLCDVFDDIYMNLSDMQMEYYIQYINRILPLRQFRSLLVTNRCLIKDEDGDFIDQDTQKGTTLEITTRLNAFSFEDEEGLCVVEYGVDGDEVYPLKNVSKMSLDPNVEDTMTHGSYEIPEGGSWLN